jgi:hypothetical protein
MENINANNSMNVTAALPNVPTLSRAELEQKFNRLATEWHKATRMMSSVTKMAMHPAYQKIIAMGLPVMPLILRDLEQTRDHWLWALHVLTEEDPAPENASFDQAVDAWLEWGKQRGFLS